MGTILVVRHGETQLNHDNKVRGWADVPLNHRGINEALSTARLLENWPIAQIFASDLIRTKQTAQIISKLNFVPIFYSAFLRSWNTGHEMVGMDLDEAIPIMQYYVAHRDETPKGGESFNEFLRRVRVIWDDILTKSMSTPKAMVIVTSSRDIDAFRYFVTKNEKYLDKDNAVTPGQVAQFNVEANRIVEVAFDAKDTNHAGSNSSSTAPRSAQDRGVGGAGQERQIVEGRTR
jgi:broad specificity phosphatase PhoE